MIALAVLAIGAIAEPVTDLETVAGRDMTVQPTMVFNGAVEIHCIRSRVCGSSFPRSEIFRQRRPTGINPDGPQERSANESVRNLYSG